ncbi:MAG TPA: glycosyltransferase family 39 protein [Candidatus Sabulitectum sp.]|nr:glycosyltransferase family 39 protein [Candidatus Sabulitectum sp.]
MKRGLFTAGAIILAVAFTVYAHSPLRFAGPMDKLVQLFTLVPAAILLTTAGWRPFRGVVAFLGGLPTGIFLGVLLVPVLGFTIYTALYPLEGIPKGGDEAAYFVQSRIYSGGRAAAPLPPVDDPRDVFPFRHFIFTDSEWFVMYTPLHGMLMVPFTSAGISWLLGPLESALSLLGAFLLMRRLAGERAARLGTGVMAVSPFFLFMGASHMAHNTNLMFVTWALYLLVSGVKDSRGMLQAGSGFLLGLALATKPYPIVPWTLTITISLICFIGWRALPVLLRMAAGAVLPTGFLMLSNWRYTGDPFSPAYNLARGGALMGFGENAAWFPEYGDNAHTPLRGLINLLKQAGTGSTILLGWPFLSLLPPAAVILDRDLLRRTWPLYLSILMVAPFMFVHYAASVDYGPRHYYTTLPAFALLSAAGLEAARKRFGEAAVTFTGTMLVICTFMVYLPDGTALRSGPWQGIDNAPARAAASAEIPAVVFMEASEHGYPNIMSGLLANDPFLEGDVIFLAHQTAREDAALIQGAFSGRNAYLFYVRGRDAFLEPWTEDLADELVPERALRPDWAPENQSD